MSGGLANPIQAPAGTAPITGTVSLGDTFGASFRDALATNPGTALLSIIGDQMRKREGEALSLQQQEEMLAAANLSGQIDLEESATRESLEQKIEWRTDELARQAIFQASDGGVMAGATMFIGGMAGSVVDPLNIASAFVPTMAMARFSQTASRVLRGGRATPLSAAPTIGQRIGVGAAEGAAGAAIVEPLVLLGAETRNADYNITDSLANIAFGASIGGGLHGLGGAIQNSLLARAERRRLDGLDAEVRAATLRAGAAAMAEGYKPTRLMESMTRIGKNPRKEALRGGTTLPTQGAPAISNLDKFVGDVPTNQNATLATFGTFTARGAAEREAKRLRRQGQDVYTRKVAEGQYAVELEVDPGTFARDPQGNYRIYTKEKTAKKNLNRMRKEGDIEDGTIVRVGDDFLITTESDPDRLAAIQNSRETLELPVDLPRMTASDAAADIRNVRLPENRIGHDTQTRLAAAAREQVRKPRTVVNDTAREDLAAIADLEEQYTADLDEIDSSVFDGDPLPTDDPVYQRELAEYDAMEKAAQNEMDAAPAVTACIMRAMR